MVDTWKYISHVSVRTSFGSVLFTECVPICTTELDARYYPIWKVVQRLKRLYDCSLFTFDVKVSSLSKSRVNSFSGTRLHSYSYYDVKPMFALYE